MTVATRPGLTRLFCFSFQSWQKRDCVFADVGIDNAGNLQKRTDLQVGLRHDVCFSRSESPTTARCPYIQASFDELRGLSFGVRQPSFFYHDLQDSVQNLARKTRQLLWFDRGFFLFLFLFPFTVHPLPFTLHFLNTSSFSHPLPSEHSPGFVPSSLGHGTVHTGVVKSR